MLTKVIIKTAINSGACYGVERALEITNKAIEEHDDVSTFGELIHNPVVVESLSKQGVNVIESAHEATGTVVLRSHGVKPETEQDISKRAVVIDATCPYVKKAQVVARNLGATHSHVIIVGERCHPEVEALVAYAERGGAHVMTVSCEADLTDAQLSDVGVLSQTTQSSDTFKKIVAYLKSKDVDLEVKNTICSATKERQTSAMELANKSDFMLVLGGKNSANTTRLFELCKEKCDSTFHIEKISELDALKSTIKEQIESCNKQQFLIGITAGASTPQVQIKELKNFLAESFELNDN